MSVYNVDEYFNSKSSIMARFEQSLLSWLFFRKFLRGKHTPPSLCSSPSPLVDDLKVIRQGEPSQISSGLVVGTVRMGYGHHRIASAACSWALAQGVETYLHDLLAIESAEAEVIAGVDKHYSQASRLASNIGGPVEWFWGKMTSRGNLNSLRTSCAMANSLKGLMSGINPDLPQVSSYPLNGQMAIASGCQRVVNMVIDNYAQHFLLVPGAVNLVQSPNNYFAFRDMGVPSKDLEVGGHWVHRDIVVNLENDSKERIRRALDGQKRRLLIPVGGAGAQREFLKELIKNLAPQLQEERIKVVLNTGDHEDMYRILKKLATDLKVPFDEILDYQTLIDYCKQRPLSESDDKNEKPLTICHFKSHFEAFSATDRLVRICDILATKPSELAFCPIPKLHIRRVGDHEAASARRSAELGDGTPECRTPRQAAHMLSLLTHSHELSVMMNEKILSNAEQNIYHGAKVAIDLASSL